MFLKFIFRYGILKVFLKFLLQSEDNAIVERQWMPRKWKLERNGGKAVDAKKVEAGSGILTVKEVHLEKVKAGSQTSTDAEASGLKKIVVPQTW